MKRNVVLICLDTVRKDIFDNNSDKLQQLSDVSFSQCRAASSWSVPSHASMMTGDLPSIHGVHTDNATFKDLDRSDTFLSSIPDHNSICVSANTWATSTFGFTDLFDEYSEVSSDMRFSKGGSLKEFFMESFDQENNKYLEFLRYSINHSKSLRTFSNGAYQKATEAFRRLPLPSPFDNGAKLTSSRIRDHTSETDEPFFLFANYMDAHSPHHKTWWHDELVDDIPNDWDSKFAFDFRDIILDGPDESVKTDIEYYRRLYAASTRYLDKHIAALVSDIIDESKRETTVIITSDHGENLAYPEEDDLLNHISSLSESVLHVPMYIINPPSGYSKIENDYFSHLKLGELISSLAQGDTPDLFEDHISAELIGGNHAIRNAISNEEELKYWDRMQRCVYSENKKYLWDSLGNTSMYEIDFDNPCWQRHLEDGVSIPEFGQKLFEVEISKSKKSHSTSKTSRDVDEETKRQLKKLGYR